MTLHLEINVEDAHIQIPYMKFLSVRSDICRRLPSDFNSRWTPLPLTIQFPLLGLTRDLHPLDNAHAERTTKKETSGSSECLFFYFVVSARSLPLPVKASDKNICCESRLISSSPGSDDLSEPGCAASRPGESATRAHTRGSHQP